MGFGSTFPQDCGYPTILGKHANGTDGALNASAAIGADGSSVLLTAAAPDGFTPTATAYGRASWPRTVFFSKEGLPLLPWFSAMNETDPSKPPSLWAAAAPAAGAGDAGVAARLRQREPALRGW